jgi:hypothetical protein
VKGYNKVIRNISVSIAGIFEKCDNLTLLGYPEARVRFPALREKK